MPQGRGRGEDGGREKKGKRAEGCGKKVMEQLADVPEEHLEARLQPSEEDDQLQIVKVRVIRQIRQAGDDRVQVVDNRAHRSYAR